MTEIESRDVAGNQKVRKKGKKRRMLIFIFLPLGGLGYSLWTFLSMPSVGTIQPPMAEEKASTEPKKEYIRYQGKYVSFAHGASYQEKSHEISDKSPIKEQVVLNTAGIEGSKIAVTVRENSGAGLASDSSFQYREKHPEEYFQKKIENENFQGVIYSKNRQVFEETAFLLKDAMIASISVTSPLTAEGLSQELDQLIESLSFGE